MSSTSRSPGSSKRTWSPGANSCVARAAVANKNKADAFVRIHANAYKDPARTGAMTICIKKTNPYCPQTYEKSQLLSAKILNTYFKVVGCRREHVWETDTMTGNNWSQVPTTLIEMGYMDMIPADFIGRGTFLNGGQFPVQIVK